MVDVRKEIVGLIKESTGLNCYYLCPPIQATFPCIVYNETENSTYKLALGNEYANLSYTFTIYAKEPVKLFDIVKTIDEAMRGIGFIKDYSSSDMYSDNLYSKAIRFKAIINHKYEIYN